MVRLALTYKKLGKIDFKVLSVIEKNLSKYEYIPVEVIEYQSRLPSVKVHLSLGKLNNLKLVQRRTGSYTGYRLTWMGLDVLALHSLVERGILYALGDKLGVGKESDVYSAESPTGERLILKLHRLGRTSFQRILLLRPYLRDKPWASWMLAAKIAGEREYKILVELYEAKASVPRPVGYSRHAVVIEYIEGVELHDYRVAEDPEHMFGVIVDTLRIAYQDVGIVHGDLSEYNILVTVLENGEEKPIIIDWPQYVPREDPSAESLLARDVEYVARFFRRAYGYRVDPTTVIKYVKGEVEEWK